MPQTPLEWHASHAVCFADCCSTISIISPETDTVCYTLCVATPYILCPSVYFEVSPPPPENPRSAPGCDSTASDPCINTLIKQMGSTEGLTIISTKLKNLVILMAFLNF